jgi:hypothetical protein
LRSTSEIRSAIPPPPEGQRERRLPLIPKPMTAAPQARPAMITTTPGRLIRPVQPLVAAPSSAPSAGAADSSPNVAEPPWKCSRASAGNSADGIPKIIALVSTASMPPTTALCLTA